MIRADSAGITIVENHRPLYREWCWRVGDEASMVIDGEFGKVVGAFRFANGRYVVADGLTAELLFYSDEGTLLFSRGGEGQGPGEFERLSAIYRLSGDSLVVFDSRRREISLYNTEGTLVTEFRVGIGLRAPVQSVYPLSSSEFLVRVDSGPSHDGRLGAQRGTAIYLKYRRVAQDWDTIAQIPGREIYGYEVAGTYTTAIPLFANVAIGIGVGRNIYLGSSDRFEIQQYDRLGRLVRLVRIEAEDRRLTQEDIERERDARLTVYGGEVSPSADMRKWVDPLPAPKQRPAYATVISDQLGNLWLGEYRTWPVIGDPKRWFVFNNVGRWLAVVNLPERLLPLDIGDDYILVRNRDSLGTESIELYPLLRCRE